jgi:hypothetical protein
MGIRRYMEGLSGGRSAMKVFRTVHGVRRARY